MRDLYTKNSDKGGEGVQNLENLADVIYEWPHTRNLPKFCGRHMEAVPSLPSVRYYQCRTGPTTDPRLAHLYGEELSLDYHEQCH